jgi:hypothetical protein
MLKLLPLRILAKLAKVSGVCHAEEESVIFLHPYTEETNKHGY